MSTVHTERRRAFMEQMGDGVAILASAPLRTRVRDVTWEFRQDSDFYYLTGFDEPQAVCVLAPGHPEHRFVLFVRPRDLEREVWDGARAGVEGAASIHGADAAFPIAELEARLPDYLDGSPRLFYRLGEDRGLDETVIRLLRRYREDARSDEPGPSAVVDPGAILHEMRLHKEPGEVEELRRVAEVTAAAHREAMRVARPGLFEYEIRAVVEATFLRHGCARPAYPSIVASGPNATVLHYTANDRRMEAGDLLLLDAGAECRYYSSDVTRTFPVDGRFTPPQRAIYDRVLAAQLAVLGAVGPGATLGELQAVAVRVLTRGLVELGLLAGEEDALVDTEAYKRFYMHGIGHWIGMDIRDPGRYKVGGVWRPLEPGMVVTVEPGLYLAPGDEGLPPEYRGIGVRIEDVVVVTEEGGEVLTAGLPKAPEAIERLMAEARAEGG